RAVQPGERLNIMGPLGKGFALPEADQPALLVAGGVGIAPLHLLARRLSEQGRPVTVLWGGASREAVDLGMETSWPLLEATMDGSIGYQGMVTDLLVRFLEQEGNIPWVGSCGPEPMLRQVARVCASKGVAVQLCFEARMACGWGVCLGCAVAVKDGQGSVSYKRVCSDGPVFWGHELTEW
ncbi:MAG TPA: dihydroorotate dehydrogenase electron transfer subunit, partial [bacterium]|nr:dihydroorotate dehydrogenase electron transfer subunit [bacterium]